ncbi:MAG: hypothetical protein S4CHLAM81_03860 [Chlamydiales bacterium]|nr:hypothetical protein [Chlamydiales bacterium]MCH9635175.1 hypothetical protein [Chlamydiales bacterium]MCH9703429.1 CPBP family intramembrane metalloprotease [Chlamydiota bacterium]
MELLLPALFALAVSLYLWRRGYFVLPSIPVYPIRFRQLLGIFLLYIAVTAVMALPLVRFAKSSYLPWMSLLYLFVIFVTQLGYLLLMKREAAYSILWGGAPVKLRVFFRTCGFGVVSWFLAYPCVLVINGLIKLLFGEGGDDQLALQFLKSTLDRPLLLAATLLFVVVVVPFSEELLFRGFLQTWLRKRFGVLVSLLLSSALFALVHYSGGQNNVEVVGSLFVLALFLGYLYERERLLWAPIALHATFNLVTCLSVITS